jgi:hypothetical protein
MFDWLEIHWLSWQLVSNPGDTARLLALIVGVLLIIWGGSWYALRRTSVLMLALLLPFVPASPVLAQGQSKVRAAPSETFPPATRNVTGTNIPCDPANLLPGCRHADGTINTSGGTDDLLTKLLKVQKVDLIYAKALADAAGTDGAKMRSKCWGTWATLIDQQTGTDAKDAQGNPLGPAPSPDLFTKIEQAGQIADALAPASPFMIACTPVAQAIKMTIAQFVTAAASGVLTIGKFVPGL